MSDDAALTSASTSTFTSTTSSSAVAAAPIQSEPPQQQQQSSNSNDAAAASSHENGQTNTEEEDMVVDPVPASSSLSASASEVAVAAVSTGSAAPSSSSSSTPSAAPSSSSSSTAAASSSSTSTSTTEDASRKRRSRWAPAPAASSSTGAVDTPGGTGDDGAEQRKKSRWSQPATAAPTDPLASVLQTLTPEQLEQFKIQLRIDDITRLMANPVEALRDREMRDASTGRARSPSPEPIYDASGNRTNTRASRYVKQLERERQELIEAMQKANPQYKVPAGFKKIKYERRLMIPIKEFPEYNFIGMIIGPRGHTQKRMEKESGCRIVIRGRGSQKNETRGKPQPGDDDDLHVLISGEDEKMVIATTKEVEKLLIPVDETKNEHKARQLRELAVINGTLRDDIICRMCGLPGHLQLHCPQRNQNWKPANIRCNICNSDLHPTADCPQRFHRTQEQAAREMNNDFESFMNEFAPGSGPVASRPQQQMYLEGGERGGGGGGGGGGDHHPPTPSSSSSGPPPGGAGYIHPDRLASRGDPNILYRDRDGVGRVVKGADPRDTYREFRPAAAANAPHLAAVSHRDGFRDPPSHSSQYPPDVRGYPPSQHQPPYHYPPQHGQGPPSYHAYPPPQSYSQPGGGGGGWTSSGPARPPPQAHQSAPPPPGTY